MSADPLRKIEVVPHDPRWKDRFLKESAEVARALGNAVVRVHHIGSTAVPGLKAKPIIDMLVEVTDIRLVDPQNSSMARLGYTPMGEFGITGRRFFLKGLHHRTHHVHVFEVGDPEIGRHLNFRDFLTAHPSVAQEYGHLKEGLAARFTHDIDGYCDGKDAFIKEIDRRAEEWGARETDG